MDETLQQQPLITEGSIEATTAQQITGDMLDDVDDDLRGALMAVSSRELSPEQVQHLVGMLRERNDAWLEAHANPITTEEFASAVQQLRLAVPEIDLDRDPRNANDDHIRLLFRSLWREHRIILASNNRFYRARDEPPRWLMGLLGITDEEASVRRIPRRSIAPAFILGDHVGVGRISSSQISAALFEMCIAPKAAWEKTTKGFPRYVSCRGKAEIAFILRPEVLDLKNLSAQVAAMDQICDDLSIRDWDIIAAMMAQVLRDGRPDATAFVYADTILDYRQVERKKGKDGYSAGHQRNMRLEVADSIQRFAHLYVTTKTLEIRRKKAHGKIEVDTVDWNEKVLQLHGNATRREDDAELAWQYSFGQWFTTFLENPNRFVAYILQRALAYHPIKQQWTKQLAHYLTLEMRKNADNGCELRRTVGELLKGAGITVDPRYPNKAKDRLEGAIRDVIRDGLFRVEHDGKVLDASTPEAEIARWTATSKALPARNWFAAYSKEVVVFRTDPETEARYDEEIRHRKNKGLNRQHMTIQQGAAQ